MPFGKEATKARFERIRSQEGRSAAYTQLAGMNAIRAVGLGIPTSFFGNLYASSLSATEGAHINALQQAGQTVSPAELQHYMFPNTGAGVLLLLATSFAIPAGLSNLSAWVRGIQAVGSSILDRRS